MMKRALVLATLMSTTPAYALVPVEDLPNLHQNVKGYLQTLEGYKLQLQQLIQEAQTAGYVINQFRAVTAAPTLANTMGLLGTLGISDPLPISPYVIQALLTGQGGLNGTLGTLSTLSNTAFSSNHIYTSPDNTWASQQSAASAAGIANAQGLAEQIHQQMATRFQILGALRSDMLAARTPSEREQVAAQIASEQAWSANSNSQLQAISVMASMQRDNRYQQADEHMNQSLDNEIKEARALGYIR